jgi:hypothetical protein
LIYEIAVDVVPKTFAGGTLNIDQPTQLIAKAGKLTNVEWLCEFEIGKEFTEQEFALAAKLLVYANQNDQQQGKTLQQPDTIPVPISAVSLKRKKAATLTLKGVLEFLKELFGFIGAIPTAILAFAGLQKLRKRPRRKRPHKKGNEAAPTATKPATSQAAERSDEPAP